MEDPALIGAVRAGDHDAFSVVVERETARVYGACLRILGRPHDAEDVAQEAFMTAYRSIRGYRGEGPVGHWILRIATRLAYRRLAGRRPTAELDAVPESRLAVAGGDPAGIVVGADERERLRRAVADLPEPYREVVALRFFGDLALAEVAEATGRPLNTVKTHLRRGLERLRLQAVPGSER